MPLSSPPTAVAPFDKGRLNAGLTATATTCYIAPIFKTVNGVRVKQGINTTSGCAIISAGDFTELVTYTGASVDATTKITTITGLTRGRDPTQTTASSSFAGGTGRPWAKGAKFTVVADATYFQSGVFTNVANTFTAVQTFGAGGAVRFSGTDTSGLRVKTLTTAQRDALTPSNGDFIYNSDTGVMNQYIAGAWAAVGTDATSNASTTVAGKVEEATAAELGAGTAAGGTGARLFINPSLAVKTSSGASDENKIPVLDSSGRVANGFLGTGTANSSTFLRGDRAWSSITASLGLYGDGNDGAVTWSVSTNLDPSTEKRYTTATLDSGQTLSVSSVNTPLIIHNTGDVTINGTVDLDGKGGAGGSGTSGAGVGGDGTAGNSIISGWTNGRGTGASNSSDPGGGGSGASWDSDGGAAATNGTEGTSGTKIDSDKYAFLASIMRGVVCGGGGGGGSASNSGGAGNAGAGGAGGGALVWLIGGNLTLGASSVIKANGANGTAGSGTSAASGQTAGGGGGGGGGMIIILVAGSITNSGVTTSATAGSGANGHNNGSSSASYKGGDGGAGRVIIYSLSTGTTITA